MNLNQRRVFDDENKLHEMLCLSEFDGWSDVRLAKKYKCDRTSILHQRRKHGILSIFERKGKARGKMIFRICKKCGEVFKSLSSVSRIYCSLTCSNSIKKEPEPVELERVEITGERINPGKNYQEYLNN